MELVTKKVGDILVIGLAEPGDLEAQNVEAFRGATASLIQDVPGVLLDMTNVTFLDSSGLGALVAIWRTLSSRRGKIKLSGVRPMVRTVFDMTRMDRIFEMYDTEQEALASYDAGPDS